MSFFNYFRSADTFSNSPFGLRTGGYLVPGGNNNLNVTENITIKGGGFMSGLFSGLNGMFGGGCSCGLGSSIFGGTGSSMYSGLNASMMGLAGMTGMYSSMNPLSSVFGMLNGASTSTAGTTSTTETTEQQKINDIKTKINNLYGNVSSRKLVIENVDGKWYATDKDGKINLDGCSGFGDIEAVLAQRYKDASTSTDNTNTDPYKDLNLNDTQKAKAKEQGLEVKGGKLGKTENGSFVEYKWNASGGSDGKGAYEKVSADES